MIDKTKKTVEEISKDYADMHQDVSAELGKYLVSAVFQDGFKEAEKIMYSAEEVNEIISEAWLSAEDNEGETFTEARTRIFNSYKK